MAIFHNLGVKLRGCLCDVPRYASAQPLVVLDLVDPALAGLNRKPTHVPVYSEVFYEWALPNGLVFAEDQDSLYAYRKNSLRSNNFIEKKRGIFSPSQRSDC